jgi:hypothetical protein
VVLQFGKVVPTATLSQSVVEVRTVGYMTGGPTVDEVIRPGWSTQSRHYGATAWQNGDGEIDERQKPATLEQLGALPSHLPSSGDGLSQ